MVEKADENPVMKYLTLLLSIIAIGMSGFSLYEQHYPNHDTIILVSNAQFVMGESFAGRGPKLIIVVTAINRGNRPTTVTSLTASYGYSAEYNAAKTCASGSRTGFPWDQRLIDGEARSTVPLVITPGIATSTVYSFVAGNALPREMRIATERTLNVCVKAKAIDSNGLVYTSIVPIGNITFSNDQILGFDRSKAFDTPVTLVPD